MELGAGGYSEGFEVAFFAGRFEAEALVTIGDEVFGADQTLGALAATFHFWLGESLDVVEIAIRVGGSDGGSGSGCEEGNGKKEGESDQPRGNFLERHEGLFPEFGGDFSNAMGNEEECQLKWTQAGREGVRHE